MKRAITASLCWALLAAIASAQSDNRPRADEFRGLVLNQTTVNEAVGLLGPPAEDKVDRLDVSKIGKWLVPKHKEKIFRQLTFKKVGDFKSIDLSFLDDKLMMIDLEFGKTVKPEKLRNLFGVEFADVGGWSDLPDKPGQYPNAFYATHYPPTFPVVGISDQAFIWANCSASSLGQPTRVNRTRQISRLLEKK